MALSGRKGEFGGVLCTFTHTDPNTGKVWSDDIRNGEKEPRGRWVYPENVKWINKEQEAEHEGNV